MSEQIIRTATLIPASANLIFTNPDKLPERIKLTVYQLEQGELACITYHFPGDKDAYSESQNFYNTREAALSRIGELYPDFEKSRVEINVRRF